MPEAAAARVSHSDLANALRALAMDAVEQAKSGHPGLPMGAADVATVLFTQFLKYDAADPRWPDRDRFVLSAGHGSMLLYALLHLTGVEGITIDELKRFRQLESKTPGHPEYFMTPGVETTTGPLGQGLGTAVGMALAERMLAAEFGRRLVDHHTYVLASDGDLMEGVSQEAIALAGHLRLDQLIVLFDDNGISIDGPLSLSDSIDQVEALRGRGLARGCASTGTIRRRSRARSPGAALGPADADRLQDHDRLRRAEEGRHLEGAWRAARRRRACRRQGGARLERRRLRGARRRSARPGREAGRRGRARAQGLAEARSRRSPRAPRRVRAAHRRASAPPGSPRRSPQLKERLVAEPQTVATRKASEIALEVDHRGGARARARLGRPDAVEQHQDQEPDRRRAGPLWRALHPLRHPRARHGGGHERACAAWRLASRPARTFLVFTDYARPAIRIAALSGIPAIYVMTHDSIGLGEDGPTHQPVEHLAALRAMPNLRVFRPADAVETAECWQLALERTDGPTVLALTRQNLPQLRTEARPENLLRRRRLRDRAGRAARPRRRSSPPAPRSRSRSRRKSSLPERGMAARVVSVPSLELLLAPARPTSAAGSSAMRRSRSRSRRRCASAGTRSSAPTASSSA